MGWNQSSQPEADLKVGRRRRKSGGNAAAAYVLGAVSALAICTAAVWWLSKGGDNEQWTVPSGETHGLKKMSGGASGAKAQKPEDPDPARQPQKAAVGSEARQEGNGVAAGEGEDGAAQDKAVTTNAEILARLERFKKEPVKGLAEQLIMMVIPPKKGEIVPPPPIGIETTPELEREAEAMLERQGVVEEWDDDNSIEIKERLELLKDQWYAFKKEGGTFHEFLQKRLSASNFDTETLTEARKFDSESFNDQSLSDEEYDKLHNRVNKLLEIQGFDKIERPDADIEPKTEEEQ